MKEFNEYFFPNKTEQERIAKMTPEELGEYWANDALMRLMHEAEPKALNTSKTS